jgi:sortase A
VAQTELLESTAEPEPEHESGSEPGSGSGSGNSSRRRTFRRGPEPLRPARPGKPARRRPVVQGIGVTISLLSVLMLGFFVYLYGLSGISEQRAQSVLYKTFAGQLSQATAPTGPTAEGAPVAILNIPSIGVHDTVIVEGTSAEDLTHGPGHLRATVLPGQYGVSVIYGRNVTYGGPFARLMELRRGDRITVTTGQGSATYIVESFGTTAHPAPDPTANRLLLETGDSPGYPTGWAQVSADLWSAPQPTPTAWPAVTAQELPLAGNPAALLPLVLWAQALLLVSLGGSLAAFHWSRWAALLCTAPVALALVWTVYENLSLLLPNLY